MYLLDRWNGLDYFLSILDYRLLRLLDLGRALASPRPPAAALFFYYL